MICFTPSKIKKFQDWIENEILALEDEMHKISNNESKLLTQLDEDDKSYYASDKAKIEKELKEFQQLRNEVERELDKVKLYFGLMERGVPEKENQYEIPRDLVNGLADFGKPVMDKK